MLRPVWQKVMGGQRDQMLALKAGSRFFRYAEHPNRLMREVFDKQPWGAEESPTGHPGQQQVLRDLMDPTITEIVLGGGRGTGKTGLAAMCVLIWEHTAKNRVCVTTAPRFQQVKDGVWREIRELHGEASIGKEKPLGKCDNTKLDISPVWFAIGTNSDKPDNLRVYHGQGGVLFIADEAPGIPDPIYDAADGFLTQEGCKSLYLGNPVRRAGRFWELFRPHVMPNGSLPEPRVRVGNRVLYQMSAFDSPLVTEDWVEARRNQYGHDFADDPRWYYNVLGAFPLESENDLISYGLLELSKELRPGVGDRHIGFDVARMGADKCVALLLVDGVVRQVYRWGKRKLHESAAILARCMQKWDVEPANVHVDSIGVGSGVCDWFRDHGMVLDEVNVAKNPQGDWIHLTGHKLMFANRRAELFWVLRRLLEDGSLCIPEQWSALWQELTAIEYKYRVSDNALQIVPKEETKKILGRSPDDADALALAHSRVLIRNNRTRLVGASRKRAS